MSKESIIDGLELWLMVIALCIFGLVLCFPIMWCWNYVMSYLFSLPVITWGQAWCLNFLLVNFIKPIIPNKRQD